jgi:hypothetical protein
VALDHPVVPVAGDRAPGVNQWLTAKALPAVRGLVTKARGWRLHRAAPGAAGALGLSVAVGGLAGHLWAGTGAWVALGAGSLFLLRLDSRI